MTDEENRAPFLDQQASFICADNGRDGLAVT